MTPTTAILYARVSSASQAEEEVSIPAQLDAGRARAARDGSTLLREFVDEGRSAYIEANRRQFEAAIDYAVTHEVGIFYTWSSSRFARNKLEAVKFKRELERAGVKLVYLSMNVDLSTDEGWLLDSFFEIMDEQRSRDTSKDTRRSLIHLAQQGYWVLGLAPFGYRSIPAPDNQKRRKLVPNDVEADLARTVFDLRATGLGAKSIADRMNSSGVRYRNRRWTKPAVLHLLRNRALIGESIFNRVESRTGRVRPESEWLVIGTHDAIIPLPLWRATQAAMDATAEPFIGKGRTRSNHLFTGILRCGKCGSAMTVEKARGRGGTYSYYSCRTAKIGGLCAIVRYPADKIDAALNGTVMQRLLTPENLRGFAYEMARVARQEDAARTHRLQEISGKTTALRARNNRLYEILELHGKDAPNLADISQRLRENNAEIRALDAAAAQIEAEAESSIDLGGIDYAAAAEALKSVLLEGSEPNRIRVFYAGFIESISLLDGQASIHYDPARLVNSATPDVHSFRIWGG